jgi:FkbM family methyltransferase
MITPSQPDLNMSPADLLISVCTLKDIETWSFAAESILRNIESESYMLIVPGDCAADFIKCTPSQIDVISEEDIIPSSFINVIAGYLDNASGQSKRAGWIYQQFLKIQAVLDSHKDRIVLWDSDTVPLKKIYFFDDSSRAYFFTGSELHEPYFKMINSILGLSKSYEDSFIAQSLPLRRQWIIDLCKDIKGRTGAADWKQGILSHMTPSLGESPFSEYETIGTYAMRRLKRADGLIPQANPRSWLRNGYELIGPASNLSFFHHSALSDAAFVSFERWSRPFSHYSNPLIIQASLSLRSRLLLRTKLLLSIGYHSVKMDFTSARKSIGRLVSPVTRLSYTHESEEEKIQRFLSDYFPASPLSSVVQIGANDGVQNDPLRPFLPEHKGSVILVEALPHYCVGLKELYSNQSNVRVINALIASKEEERNLFYINPGVADEMDGDGPLNRWAHGQGSFSKETIISWIQKNQFRGSKYRANLQRYIDSIESTLLRSITLASLARQCQLAQIDLLVIDVQGAELEVLSTLHELENLPRFIVYEDDSSLARDESKALELLLTNCGYVSIAGNVNRFWGLDSSRLRGPV